MRVVIAELRDNAAAPYGGNQIIAAHDAVAVLHKVDEQVKDLRLDRHGLIPPAKFATFHVEKMVAELEQHNRLQPDCRDRNKNEGRLKSK